MFGRPLVGHSARPRLSPRSAEDIFTLTSGWKTRRGREEDPILTLQKREHPTRSPGGPARLIAQTQFMSRSIQVPRSARARACPGPQCTSLQRSVPHPWRTAQRPSSDTVRSERNVAVHTNNLNSTQLRTRISTLGISITVVVSLTGTARVAAPSELDSSS